MMRRHLSLVSSDKHALREVLTVLCQDPVTLAILRPQIPRTFNTSVNASAQQQGLWANVTLQLGVLAIVLLARSADGACYAIMASTPDDNFHYQAIMQTLGTCQPSQVK